LLDVSPTRFSFRPGSRFYLSWAFLGRFGIVHLLGRFPSPIFLFSPPRLGPDQHRLLWRRGRSRAPSFGCFITHEVLRFFFFGTTRFAFPSLLLPFYPPHALIDDIDCLLVYFSFFALRLFAVFLFFGPPILRFRPNALPWLPSTCISLPSQPKASRRLLFPFFVGKLFFCDLSFRFSEDFFVCRGTAPQSLHKLSFLLSLWRKLGIHFVFDDAMLFLVFSLCFKVVLFASFSRSTTSVHL